jgi:hypothetical protein
MAVTAEKIKNKEFVLPERYKDVPPFDHSQATRAIDQYGGDPSHLGAMTGSSRDWLLRVTGESIAGRQGLEVEIWMRDFFSNSEVRSRSVDAYNYEIEYLQSVVEHISRLPNTEELVIALKGLRESQSEMRQETMKSILEKINDHLKTTHEKKYWAIVDTVSNDKSEGYSPGYHKTHSLAQLTGVGITDDGLTFALLAQADGQQGYRQIEQFSDVYWEWVQQEAEILTTSPENS